MPKIGDEVYGPAFGKSKTIPDVVMVPDEPKPTETSTEQMTPRAKLIAKQDAVAAALTEEIDTFAAGLDLDGRVTYDQFTRDVLHPKIIKSLKINHKHYTAWAANATTTKGGETMSYRQRASREGKAPHVSSPNVMLKDWMSQDGVHNENADWTKGDLNPASETAPRLAAWKQALELHIDADRGQDCR